MQFHNFNGKVDIKINPKGEALIQWHTQAGSSTTNLKDKMYFTLPELSPTKIVTWKFHVDEYAKGRYDIIFGRDIWTALGLNLEFSDRVIEADDGYFKGSKAPMVDLGMYEFKDLNTGKITPGELFMNSYA